MADKKEKKQNQADQYQLAAIKSNINSVVSAGAGSGKTSVLSQRFLDLVQNRNCNVDQILTLTFTKKATVEMSSRIYKVLKENSPEQAANFYKANIKTIDAYCNSVAKMGAHFYGISPDFTQDKESIDKKINEMALPFILKNRDSLAIKKLVKTNNYDQIAQEIFANTITTYSTVVSEIDFEKDLERQKTEIKNAWKENQDKIFNAMNLFMNDWNSLPEKKDSKTYDKIKKHLQPFTPPYKSQLTEEDINNHNTSNIEETFNQLKYFCTTPSPGQLKDLREAAISLKSAKEIIIVLEEIILFIQNLPVISALIPLMKEFQTMANNFKRQSGILSFSDISALALKTLIEHPEIRKTEKDKYKAIMIDEFQDNNQMQRDMLFLLAEKPERTEKSVPRPDELCPDKLFFVGDEKQSIYLFRGADVSVFRKLSLDFKEGNLQMTNNYRSHQSLIASFNTIFGGYKFPPSMNEDSEDSQETEEINQPSVFFSEKKTYPDIEIPEYEAVYHKVTLSDSAKKEITKDNYKEIYQPHIHIAKTDNEETEAEWVAQKIKALITTGADENGPVNPGDIAILFKSYEPQSRYERVLLKYGIPYNTETVKGFFSDGPVNDIFSFLRLCVYPSDTLSYAQILRSPFVNLSITEINAILLQDREPFNPNNLNLLSPDGQHHYQKAADFYQEIKKESKTATLTDLINIIWYKAGYRYETLWNQQVSMYSKLYDLIFEFARQCQLKNMSLAAFVDELRNYKDEQAKLDNMDIPIVQKEGVHLMSIHKSKGLEFKIVFIPVTNKKGQQQKNNFSVYYSKEYGFTVNTSPSQDSINDNKKINYFFDLAKKENALKANAELRRLTYVALTRAINSLYISKCKEDPKTIEAEDYTPGNEKNLENIYNTLYPVLEFYKEKENSPFTFEDIELEENLSTQSDKVRPNTQEAKYQLLEDFKTIDVYNSTDNKKIISLDEVMDRYILPSQLMHQNQEQVQKQNTREDLIKAWTPQEDTPYKEINTIIIESLPHAGSEKETQPRFSFANFGTIAHSYLEAALSPEKNLPEYSNKDIVGLENNQNKLLTVQNVCKKMSQDFLSSSLGQKATAADWKKCEYEFKYYTGQYLIHGTMDLIFKEGEGRYRVVDYKTNQTIKPEIYYNQLTLYRAAAAQLLSVKEEDISCSLFYLRFGKEVDITEECNKNIDWKEILTR
ncbi:exodeoxyribonuclease V subunit beta [Treponema sp.]|uniref:UvrD-helicase domain-containing protein n=1 Tax=Treponema sp. TaxID=166 RepID=UPI0025EE6B65|nr:UvrD-helicase domain-containing protein [Treponema sp.]MCR5218536.1 UvrD-helicase domain-containing protein [Treponema sp.]